MRVPSATLFAMLAVSAAGADLAQTLDTLANSSPLAARSNIGIHVIDARTGKQLYAHNESRFFLPASNMKLFTTALALTKLGPDYRFETRLIEEAGGDVVLVGSGDPSMSGRVYPYNRNVPSAPPLRAIEDLADQAVVAGLTRVHGDIVGDDRLYPWAPFPPNWSQSDASGESGAPISALSVADNFVTIYFTPTKSGEPVQLSLSPALEYFAIDNRIVTFAGAGEAKIRLTRTPGSRQLLFEGTLPTTAKNYYATVAIDDPALYAACALYDALTRRGIAIDGHPVARHRSNGDAYEPPEGKVLGIRTSPPASELIQMVDKVSENLHAELLLREVGRIARKSGTADAGLAEMTAFLTKIGAAPGADSRMDDGSGLSRNAQVTPRLVTQLLGYMYNSSSHDAWISMLPVGGEDGTLSRRLCCTLEAHAIHAKTGTLNRALALSGYAESKSRGWLAFSILVNDFAATAADVEAWIDKIALALTE